MVVNPRVVFFFFFPVMEGIAVVNRSTIVSERSVQKRHRNFPEQTKQKRLSEEERKVNPLKMESTLRRLITHFSVIQQ